MLPFFMDAFFAARQVFAVLFFAQFLMQKNDGNSGFSSVIAIPSVQGMHFNRNSARLRARAQHSARWHRRCKTHWVMYLANKEC